jgi:uncharacterized membrane protein YqaE (UPF0057 family)
MYVGPRMPQPAEMSQDGFKALAALVLPPVTVTGDEGMLVVVIVCTTILLWLLFAKGTRSEN